MATAERLSRAERQARTRDDLIEAARELFSTNGFHATSVDAVADAAGYTKGAVYSNFASKEDLFLAVYERRAEQATAAIEQTLREAPDQISGIETMARSRVAARGGDDGWLAVFFEFWAHVLRHPELRERFAEIHTRVIAPLAAAVEALAAEHGIDLAAGYAYRQSTAYYALQLGLQLERLTQPDVVDADLAGSIARQSLEDMIRGGRGQ